MWKNIGLPFAKSAPKIPMTITEAGEDWTPYTGKAVPKNKFDRGIRRTWTKKKVDEPICLPDRGIRYVKVGGDQINDQGEPFMRSTPENSLSIYFAKNGQIAGLHVTIYVAPDDDNLPLIWDLKTKGWYKKSKHNQGPNGEEAYTISVSFREGGSLCDASAPLSENKLGDRLVIHNTKGDVNVPMTLDKALEEGYQPGSCMRTMGQHFL